MRIKLSLLSIKKDLHKVDFVILTETDIESNKFIDKIHGLSFSQEKMKKEFTVRTKVTYIDNTIICSIPVSSLAQIPDNSFLMLSVENNQLIKISNKITRDFSITLNNTEFLLVPYFNNQHVKFFKKTSDLFNKVNAIENNRNSLVLSGYISSNTCDLGNLNNIEFYLLHDITKEKILLTNLHLSTADSNITWTLTLNSKELQLYKGIWSLLSRCSLTNNILDITIFYNGVSHNTYKHFYNLENDMHSLELLSSNTELSLLSTANTQEITYSKLYDVSLENNHLQLEGEISYRFMITEYDKITDLVLINRNSKETYYIPLYESDFNNEVFRKQIDLRNHEFFEQSSIWDVHYKYLINGASDIAHLSLDSNKENKEGNLILFPNIIFNKTGVIKKIRPYFTLDQNLAFFINDQVTIGEISKIEYYNNKITINGFIDIPNIQGSFQQVYLYDEINNVKIPLHSEIISKNKQFYFSSYCVWENLNLESTQELDLTAIAVFSIEGQAFSFPLISNSDDIREKSKAIIYPSLGIMDNNRPLNVLPYYNSKNELKFRVFSNLKASCTKLEKRGASIELEIAMENPLKKDIKSAELVLNNISTTQTITIPFQVNNNGNNIIILKSKITNNSFKVLNDSGKWEAQLLCRQDDYVLTTEITSKKNMLVKKKSTFKSNAIKIKNKIHFSLFFDKQLKKLLFEIRDIKANEVLTERIRFLFARVVAKIVRKFSHKKIWLIGENLGEVAQDNGFSFFEYCYKNHIPENFYYVSRKHNKNANNLAPFRKKVLRYDSFKHLVLYCLTEYLIVSHGIRDVIPSIVHHKMGSNPKKVIYLQHGIIAMKKLKFNRNSYNGKIKKFVVSSQQEKNILIRDMNFKPNQLMVTGLSRFDSLIDTSGSQSSKQILLMPTWRDWLVDSQTDFYESKFYKYYLELLTDSSFHKLLEKNNIILKFFPHIEMQKLFQNEFLNLHPNIKLIKAGEETVRDLIQASSLMITDYSSVVFDFNYLQKPSIFYHFDLDEYMVYRNSYVNLKTDLVGDTAYTKNELLSLISEYIENDFSYKPKYLLNSNKYYEYQDKNNSKRIYKEIKKLSK